jgi:CHAT domain-containing protein
VVSTFWPVQDATTALFMDRFYYELLGKHPAKRAARSARRWLRQLASATSNRNDGETDLAAHAVRRPSHALRSAQLWLRDLTTAQLKRHLARSECTLPAALKRQLALGCAKRPANEQPFSKNLAWAAYLVSGGFSGRVSA